MTSHDQMMQTQQQIRLNCYNRARLREKNHKYISKLKKNYCKKYKLYKANIQQYFLVRTGYL